MKSLQEEFKAILREYGHSILLVRQQKKVVCSCYDEKTQTADRECPYCFGLKYVPLVEKHTVYETDSTVPETMPMIEQGEVFGRMSVPARAYYFAPEANIDEDDLIMDVGWVGSIPVLKEGKIWEVSHVDPARFTKGELVYKKSYVKAEPVEKDIRGFHIRQVGNVMSYELMGEKPE